MSDYRRGYDDGYDLGRSSMANDVLTGVAAVLVLAGVYLSGVIFGMELMKKD